MARTVRVSTECGAFAASGSDGGRLLDLLGLLGPDGRVPAEQRLAADAVLGRVLIALAMDREAPSVASLERREQHRTSPTDGEQRALEEIADLATAAMSSEHGVHISIR